MVKRRSRQGRTHVTRTPTPSSDGKLTKIRDLNAERFSFGDRVCWCDEEAIYLGLKPGDPTIAIVRMFDGELRDWPAGLAGMRRVVKSDPDLLSSLWELPRGVGETPEELTRPDFEDRYYDDLEIDDCDERDIAVDVHALTMDLSDVIRRRRR